MIPIKFLIYKVDLNTEDFIKILSSIIKRCFNKDNISFNFLFNQENLEKNFSILNYLESFNIHYECMIDEIDKNVNIWNFLTQNISIFKNSYIFFWGNCLIGTPNWDLILQEQIDKFKNDNDNFNIWYFSDSIDCFLLPPNTHQFLNISCETKDIFHWIRDIFQKCNLLKKIDNIAIMREKNYLSLNNISNDFFKRDNVMLRTIQHYLIRLKINNKNNKGLNIDNFNSLTIEDNKLNENIKNDVIKYQNPIFSIIIPTYQRSDQLEPLIQSILSTCNNPRQIEICFVIDDNDLKSREILDKLRIKFGEFIIKYCIRKKPLIFSDLWNYGYESLATGNIIIKGNDSMRFKSKEWDNLLIDVFEKRKDKILFCIPKIININQDINTDMNIEKYTKIFIIHRNWIDISKFFIPPFFLNNLGCKWLYFIASKIQRLNQLNSFIIEDKRIFDNNYNFRKNLIQKFKPEITYKLKENERWFQYKNLIGNLKE